LLINIRFVSSRRWSQITLMTGEIDNRLADINLRTIERYPTVDAYRAELRRLRVMLRIAYRRMGQPPPSVDERIEEALIMTAVANGTSVEEALREFLQHVPALPRPRR
jgi:hypothetical protein